MKIGLLGCKGTTLDLLNHLTMATNVQIDLVITLSEENATKNKVAFYRGNDIRKYCEQHAIQCHTTQSYHLNNEEDQAWIAAQHIDLLLVIGWERLLPDAVLNALGKFACGMHGSPYGLPRGRGRSPLNWSIITEHQQFITSLFRYDAGVDSGNIIGSMRFDINAYDTISSLHSKNRIVMQQLVATYVPLIASGEVQFTQQPNTKPTYYPKRTAEDGWIDWNETTEAIYNLVRAVAFPYPSAFTYLGKVKVVIDKAQPYDATLFADAAPGTVLDVSISLQQFAVKTGNGSLLITEFSGVSIAEIQPGVKLIGGNATQIKEAIVQRYSPGIADDEKEIT